MKQWVKRYEAEGAAAFLPAKENRIYPPELKRQAVEDYLSGGTSQVDICKKYKIRSVSRL